MILARKQLESAVRILEMHTKSYEQVHLKTPNVQNILPVLKGLNYKLSQYVHVSNNDLLSIESSLNEMNLSNSYLDKKDFIYSSIIGINFYFLVACLGYYNKKEDSLLAAVKENFFEIIRVGVDYNIIKFSTKN